MGCSWDAGSCLAHIEALGVKFRIKIFGMPEFQVFESGYEGIIFSFLKYC